MCLCCLFVFVDHVSSVFDDAELRLLYLFGKQCDVGVVCGLLTVLVCWLSC